MAAARPDADAPAPAVAERTPRGQGELLRGRLLDAGLEIVSELGDESHVTIRAVTRRAGVSPTAFYLHFQNREELISALRDRGFEEFRAANASGAAAGGDDPASQLRTAGLAYMRFARERPSIYALIFTPHDPPKPGEVDPEGPGQAAFGDLIDLIETYLANAGVEVADVRRLAMGIWTGLHGYVTLRYASSKMDWPSDEEFAVQLAEAWLGPALRAEDG